MKTKLKVEIVAHTPDPEKVVAASARLCYSERGASNLMEDMGSEETERMVKMLTRIGHESPLEHVSFTFAIEGVSRVLTHQLCRHRIASYSMKSQRYVKEDEFEYVVPKAIELNQTANYLYERMVKTINRAYNNITVLLLAEKIRKHKGYNTNDPENCGPINDRLIEEFKAENKKVFGEYEKQAIEDARYLLPNACETKIVVTMNARSLLNFFSDRCCNRAQAEIRELATEMLRQVKSIAPNLFSNAGPDCVTGTCGEGNMSCGKMLSVQEKFKAI